MSIIRVSGGKHRGKISRVYGSKNYVRSAQKKRASNEKEYYTNIIQLAKNHITSKKHKNYINKTQKYGNRLAEKTLIKILKAYQDTLLVRKKQNISKKQKRQLKAKRINNNLERNLKKHKVSQSTIQKILKYEPKYNKTLAKKDTPRKKNLSKPGNFKPKATRINKKIRDSSSYLSQIINFSYKKGNEDEIDSFIKRINKNKKILSDNLIRNIIKAYKNTLNNSTNKKQRKKLINNELEDNLLQEGVHSDTIEAILKLDKNYNRNSTI